MKGKGFFSKSSGLLLIIAVLLTVLVATTSIIVDGSTDPITNAMGTLTSPLRQTVSRVTQFGEGVHRFLLDYQAMEAELTQLRLDKAEQEFALREGAEAQRENELLRELLSLQAKRRDFSFESARVTSRSFTGWESALHLDKGSKADVAVGDTVITEAGHLVGVVTGVGENWSEVSTLVSTHIHMGASVPRSGASGVLEGDFSLMALQQLRLGYLADEDTLIAGDQVITSGMGEQYPQGLTVGKVQAVFDEPSGVGRYAIIQPEVELGKLVQVFVIKDFDIIN